LNTLAFVGNRDGLALEDAIGQSENIAPELGDRHFHTRSVHRSRTFRQDFFQNLGECLETQE
jgi:hypothetical protein